jgi:PAS domain S-box-containing protein
MKSPSDNWEELRRKVLGLGDSSLHKTHYPSLRQRLAEVERFRSKLQQSETYLLEAQRLSHTGSFGWNVATDEHIWSEETFRIFELDASIKPASHWIVERVHPEDRTLRKEALDRAAREGKDLDLEYRLLMPDGSIKHIHVVAHAVRGYSGGLEFVGALMDVTAQKSQQQALEKAFQEMEALKNQFRLAIDTIPGLVWSALPDGSTEFLNQRWLDYTGLSLKEGVDWTIAAHPEDRARLGAEWRAALTGGKPLETEGRLRRADGEYRWFLIRAMPLRDATGNIVKWYGKSADIEDRKQAEAQLRESEQQYRRIVDTASEGIFACNENYITTFVNRRMAEMLGYEPEEMIGGKASDYLFEEDHAIFEERMAARRRGIPERYEQIVRCKDGHPLWVHISATPVFDAAHHFQGSFCMLSDITQRKMVEEELRKHRDHLEDLVKKRTEELALLNQLVYGSLASTDVGAWWIDFKEKDTYHALDNTVQMLGNTPYKTGENTYQLSQWAKSLADTKAAFPEYARAVDETMERFSGAISGKYKNYSAIYPVALCDGSVKWFNARADVPLRDEQGQALLMTGTIIDITKLKKAEEELVEAKERAESANRAKSIFLASISHELRTPLNVVLGFSRLMKNDQGVPANQKENLNIIVRSGEHLLDLINNVLDLSKIESGRVVLEESDADLHQLLHELQSVMGVGAAEKGLRFTLEQSPTLPRHVAVDAGKLRQVLINLIGNATKYTERGGLKLRAGVVRWEPPQRAWVRFEVEDTGPEDRQRIFFPFVRLGNRAPTEAGTGLGLAISKQYVELMGGQIDVDSEPGKGSVFHFEIPVVVLSKAETPAKLGSRRIIGLVEGQPRVRLLIAEDQRENRLLLHKLFEPLGFDLREAVNGQEAVALFEEWHPDLIWMDIRMPVMDGLEAARRIKATEAGSRTKIIALTAHAWEEERKPILAAGCDDLVHKPYFEQELFEVMARHLNLKYVYEKEGGQMSPDGSKAVIRPEQWAALPSELLTQLHQAAVELDTTRTLALIERITELDATIGGLLNDLARELDYPRLLRLLESEKTTARQVL